MSQHYTLEQYKRDAVITWLFFVAAILLSAACAASLFLAWRLDSPLWLIGGLLAFVLCYAAVAVAMEAECRMNQDEIP